MLHQAPIIGQAFHVDTNARSVVCQILNTNSVISHSIYVIRFLYYFKNGTFLIIVC